MKKSCSDKKHSSFRYETELFKIVHAFTYMFLITVIFSSLPGCMQTKEGEIILGTVSVGAGDYDRSDTPVRFECKSEEVFGNHTDLAFSDDHHLILHEKGGKKSKLPVQWEPKAGFSWENHSGQGALVWILKGKTPKNSVRTFSLVLKKGAPPSGTFSIEDIENRKLLIKNGSQPVLQYNYDIIREVEDQTNQYDRSSYIHPVWTPKGEIISGDFSPEHIWQRGIFLAWEKVKIGEVVTNFWELGKNTGRTLKDDKDPVLIQGPVFAEIVVFNKGTVEGKTYFKEICVVRLYNSTKNDTWMFDMNFCQIPVDPADPGKLPIVARSVELMKIHYGGMAFRGVSPGWLHYDFIAGNKEQLSKFKTGTKWLDPADSLHILTSEGFGRKNGNGTPARWIDYTGPLSSNWGGLVMFDHPTNQRYPTPLRIHPDMPYFCFAFTKDNPYSISSDAPLNLTYRIVVHNGHPDKDANEQISRDFVNPPEIKWKPVR